MLFRSARRRAETGYTSNLELHQAEAEYRATQQLVPAAQLAISRQENALSLLLGENPREIDVAVLGDAKGRQSQAELAVYTAWLNGWHLPERKKVNKNNNLQLIRLHGYAAKDGFAALRAQAEGNVLCRALTVLPPNELTPGA